jgi:hypothetical protein
MDSEKITRLLGRLSNLHKMAVDQKGFPEGENAARMAAKMQEDHGLCLEEGALDMHEASVKLGEDWDRDTARVIATILPVEVSIRGDEAVYRGIKVAVDEAVKHYESINAGLERVIGYTVLGYLVGTLSPKVVMAYIDSADASSTLKAGAEVHAEQSEKEDDMTDGEVKLMLEAVKVGDPIELWKGLQA